MPDPFAPPGIVLGVASLVLGAGMTAERAEQVVRAAVQSGAVAIDTARAYAALEDDSVGERLALGARQTRAGIPIITKAGHFRAGVTSWDADGSAARLRQDAQRSVDVLGEPPALLLLHRTDRVDDVLESVRALAELRELGMALRIGLSNATVEVLEQVRGITRIDAVENRLGLGVDSFDDYRYCHENDIDFLAYAPFGGPHAAPLATRVPRVAALAAARGISAHRVALAAMLDALPGCWPIIGPRRVESAVDSIAATHMVVDDDVRQAFAADLRSRDVPIPVFA
jgi:pyridoxine 4-dehydrogenase